MDYSKFRIDNIIWILSKVRGVTYELSPLCPIHHLRLEPKYPTWPSEEKDTKILICEECKKSYVLPRYLRDEIKYVKNKIDAKAFKQIKILNLDDEAIVLAESKLSSDDNKYFVTGLLTKSKVGHRLVLYAGERGKKEKSQIFVETDIKRLAFDQDDLHPTDVFTKIEATFEDNTKSTMKKK